MPVMSLRDSIETAGLVCNHESGSHVCEEEE